jgi:hypothetical protein
MDVRGLGRGLRRLRSSLLHEVLRRTARLPLLLSVVWLEVAARLDVPAYATRCRGTSSSRSATPRTSTSSWTPFGGGPGAVGSEIARTGGLSAVAVARATCCCGC